MKLVIGRVFVLSICVAGTLAMCFCMGSLAGTMPSQGQEPPSVTGTDIVSGQPVSIGKADNPTMLLLCFFALGSRASEEQLHLLEVLQEGYREAGLGVIAVSPKDGPDELRTFAESNELHYAIVADDTQRISEAYGASGVFPLTFIIAPYIPQVRNVVVGGGRGVQRMLTAIAEKLLAQGRAEAAQSMVKMAVENDPADADAKATLGYAFLAQGKLADAERTFEELGDLPDGEVAALEGMARVKVEQGQLDEAMELADTAQQKAPDTAVGATLVKAEVYERQGRMDEAERVLQAAVKKEGTEWQQSEALNELGRVQTERGKLADAVQTYSEAISIDPYNLEALSNKGATHVELGEHEKAVATLETAKLLNPQDEIVLGLLRDAVRAQRDANDIERQKLIRQQVETLKERFREQQVALRDQPIDEWSSRPLTLAMLDFNIEGGMLERAGTDRVILSQFTAALDETPRVTLVEREIIDKLLTELNLSSSDLADPNTQLRLGRLLSARVIAVGNFVPFGSDLMFSARLIDTETSRIVTSVSPNLSAHGSIGALAVNAAAKCSRALLNAYPLHGRIVDLDDVVALDLGARHGVVPGMKFRVLHEGKEIKDSNGRVLSRKQDTVAVLEVHDVEDAVSYATVLERTGTLNLNDKVTEQR